MPWISQLNPVSNCTISLFAVYLNLFSWYLCCLIFITFHFIYGIKLLDGERQESYLQLLFLLQSRCTLCNAEIETGSLIPNHGIFHFLHSLTLFHPSHNIHKYTDYALFLVMFYLSDAFGLLFLFIYFCDRLIWFPFQLLELQQLLSSMRMIGGYFVMPLSESGGKKWVTKWIQWEEWMGYIT